MSVLITAGLHPEAHRLQRIINLKDVFFTDETELPHIPGIRSFVLPDYRSVSFIHEILKACLDNDIYMIYPLKMGEIDELSRARLLFSEYNIKLLIPSDNWLQNNLFHIPLRHSNICVLENGEFKAGNYPKIQSFFSNETGIFTWENNEGNIEYNLYLARDDERN